MSRIYVASRPVVRTSRVRNPITVTVRRPNYGLRPGEVVIPRLLIERYCGTIKQVGSYKDFSHGDRGYDAIERKLPDDQAMWNAAVQDKARVILKAMTHAETELGSMGIPNPKKMLRRQLQMA